LWPWSEFSGSACGCGTGLPVECPCSAFSLI
jgi:hypothetical protein